MCKALRTLRDSGALALKNGRAYTVAALPIVNGRRSASSPQEPDRILPRHPPWRQVAQRIEEDSRTGVYQPGSALPSMKELQRRYGVTYKTLRKSLQFLVGAEAIEPLPSGGGRIPPFSTSVWRPRIVCVIPSIDRSTMAFGQNDEALFRALEVYCEQAGIKIDVHLVFFDAERSRLRFRHKSTGRIYESEDLAGIDDRSVLGYLNFIPWDPSEGNLEIIESLARHRKPVAVLDETEQLSLPRALTNARHVRVFTVATSTVPAGVVARHLLSLGHREIAFVSTYHAYLWSQRRLQGLVAACTRTGQRGNVHPFVVATTPDTIAQGVLRYDLPALAASFETWRKRVPDPAVTDFDLAFHDLCKYRSGLAEVRGLLYPLLTQALAGPGITAWVMVNDVVALMALTFLKEKGTRVPTDISVISFDDSLDALRANLSSFNFNVQAVAGAMLGFVLGTKLYAFPGSEGRGFIVDRGTTGPAPKKRPAR